MSVIFSDRKLAASFLNRSIVILSEAHRNKHSDLRFGVEFDFGKHGKWANRVDIPATNDLVFFNKQLNAYQQDLYEQIGMLEEIERWATIDPTEPFSRVLCQDKPLFFHGFVSKETLILQIFGEGLYDFEIRWDFKRAGESSSFKQKLNEFRKAIADHLRAIEAIELEELIRKSQGEAA
jgi:hypothetical protein